MTFELRYREPIGRAPARRTVPRGASRPVAKKPLRERVAEFNFEPIKRVLWPVLLVGLGVGAYFAAKPLWPYVDRPIARVAVEGELNYVTPKTVQERIEPYVTASFLKLDLDSMRRDLEALPWISEAQVRRVWPDQVVVTLQEQLPIARWGDEALLNSQGRAFAPNEVANYQHLPQLGGPIRAQEAVMRQYQLLNQMLRPLGLKIAQLELRERGSWFLSTQADDSGRSIEVLLGRDHVMDKMRRFITLYDKALKDQMTNIARIDLRYAHGLAVAWRDPVAATTATDAVSHN